jgi:hypothetical protein
MTWTLFALVSVAALELPFGPITRLLRRTAFMFYIFLESNASSDSCRSYINNIDSLKHSDIADRIVTADPKVKSFSVGHVQYVGPATDACEA